MTREQIICTLNEGGYICRTEETKPTVYDRNGIAVCGCPVATMERISSLESMTEWVEDWGGVYVAKRNNNRHNDHQNRQHCKRIAEDLAAYVSGNVRRCPECGELHEIADEWQTFKCPSCGFIGEGYEYDELYIWDYFSDCYDVEFRIGTDKEIRSVQIMVACGGPNIYIDTASKNVELYWWTDRAHYPLDSLSVDAVNDWAEEYYNCL